MTSITINQSSNSREASSAALRAIEEIADWERRKNNIIVYNLLEGVNRDADKDSASVSLNSILEQEVNISKLFHLGRKTGKNRPLLIGLDCEETKIHALAAAPRLRSSSQFPNVYISPDWTKVEQQQHKELVALLCQRREKGERNIVICIEKIVTYHLRPQHITVVNPQQPLIQLSPPLPVMVQQRLAPDELLCLDPVSKKNQLNSNSQPILNHNVIFPSSADSRMTSLPQLINQPSNKLHVCLRNARSIVNKLQDFSSFVYAASQNIYAITETWLSNHIYDNAILPSTYNI